MKSPIEALLERIKKYAPYIPDQDIEAIGNNVSEMILGTFDDPANDTLDELIEACKDHLEPFRNHNY